MQFYCFWGLLYIAFTSKINYFYYLCSASLNLKNIDCQGEVVQKELKEDLYNKTDYLKLSMKKFWITMIVGLIMASCGGSSSGNDPIPTPPTPTNEDVKVTDNDLFRYFNLDKTKYVYQAIELLTAQTSAKTVNAKTLEVLSTSIQERNDSEGTFKVLVSGKVQNKPFSHTITYTGFAKKPSDYDMSHRLSVQWKNGVDYQTQFDFDTLYRLKKNEKYTAEYLSQFIDIEVLEQNSQNVYKYTADDFAKLQISNFEFKNGRSTGTLTFVVTYNGNKGYVGSGTYAQPTLSFDKNAYYASKLQLKKEVAAEYYMRGVYENAAVFYAGFFDYDTNIYAPILKSVNKSDSQNALSVTIELQDKNGNENVLAEFTKEIEGFKPLSTLATDLGLSTTADLGAYMGKRFRSSVDGDLLARVKALPIQNWIKNVHFSLKKSYGYLDLEREEVRMSNGNYLAPVWKAASNRGSDLDAYFLEPRFEVVEAKKEGIWLNLKVKLLQVNEVSLNDVVLPLRIHLIENN